jgi:glycosyltransferase involved in cell wall biosynthesis
MSRYFFWAAGNDGSSFYRQSLPALGLTWRGHHATTSQQLIPAQMKDVDAIVGARVATPQGVAAWDLLRRAGKPLLLDMDDDYFHIDRTNVLADEFWDVARRDLLRQSMNLSDLVVAVSEPLAAVLRRETTTPVVVVPNGLPAQYLTAPRIYDKTGRVVVGWAGSSSTLHELPRAARALRRLVERFPERVEIRLVGVTLEEAATQGLTGPHISATGWIPQVPEYLKACMGFDIWVAPYRDTTYNRSKFATKALEAGMLGVPLIASAIKPYENWAARNGGVRLVREDHIWGRELVRLVEYADLRRDMGLAGSEAASASVLQSLAGTWEDTLKDAARKAARRIGAK